MARRTDHTRDELAALVIDAAERLAREEGLRSVAMRRIAAEIGYSPGSIYNAVGDFDEVVLRVNARSLARLRERLGAAADPNEPALRNALALADAFLAFVQEEPRLWGLLLEHALPKGVVVPPWYATELSETIGVVDAVLMPLLPEVEARQRIVAALWASLHGVASLAILGKLGVVGPDDPRELGRLLVTKILT